MRLNSQQIFEKNHSSGFTQTELYINAPTKESLRHQPWLKFCPLEKALKISVPEVVEIINKIPTKKQHRNILVNVYYWDMKAGDYPFDAEYWHYDVYGANAGAHPDFGKFKPENHWLICWGADCTTQFKMKDGSIAKIKEGVVNHYTQDSLHKASFAEKDGFRVLIRVTETDAPVKEHRVLTQWQAGVEDDKKQESISRFDMRKSKENSNL